MCNKIRDIENVLGLICKDFLEIISEELRSIIDGNFFMAGGCIYSLYNNKIPNDYDIFLKNKETSDLVVKYFMKYLNKMARDGTYLGKYKDFNITKTKYAITIGDFFQIILKYYGEPNDVCSEFDFKHNMFYFDPNTEMVFNQTNTSYSFLSSNKLYLNPLRARDYSGIMMRIPKFIERGFKIDKSEIAKIILKLKDCINNDNETEILLDYTNTGGY
jgi:hypothetical protein